MVVTLINKHHWQPRYAIYVFEIEIYFPTKLTIILSVASTLNNNIPKEHACFAEKKAEGNVRNEMKTLGTGRSRSGAAIVASYPISAKSASIKRPQIPLTSTQIAITYPPSARCINANGATQTLAFWFNVSPSVHVRAYIEPTRAVRLKQSEKDPRPGARSGIEFLDYREIREITFSQTIISS